MCTGPGAPDHLLLAGPGEPQEDANGNWLAVLELLVSECREPQEDPMTTGWWRWSCWHWDLGDCGVSPAVPPGWQCWSCWQWDLRICGDQLAVLVSAAGAGTRLQLWRVLGQVYVFWYVLGPWSFWHVVRPSAAAAAVECWSAVGGP